MQLCINMAPYCKFPRWNIQICLPGSWSHMLRNGDLEKHHRRLDTSPPICLSPLTLAVQVHKPTVRIQTSIDSNVNMSSWLNSSGTEGHYRLGHRWTKGEQPARPPESGKLRNIIRRRLEFHVLLACNKTWFMSHISTVDGELGVDVWHRCRNRFGKCGFYF